MGYNDEVHKKLWIYVVVLGYNIFYNFNSKIDKESLMIVYKEPNKKLPEELLFIEIIKKAFNDAFAIGNASDPNQILAKSQAKNWFDLSCKGFRETCEHAGSEPEYVLKLYQNLEYNYNSGKITKDELKFGISRLDKKI